MDNDDAARQPLDVWCESIGIDAHESTRLVFELKRAGLSCHAPQMDAAGPGIVLFRSLTEELRRRLQERSRGAMDRLIAVGIAPESLARGEGWELLQWGAADVFPLEAPSATAAAIAARFRRWAAVDAMLDTPVVRRNLVGENPRWCAFLRRVIDVGKFSTSP